MSETIKKARIGIVAPYFGPLPAMFSCWLKSAGENRDVDFYLVSDQFLDHTLPANVTHVTMTFEAMQDRLTNRLQAKRVISPYKLCDFKPTYGHLFEDILGGYEMWGHSDLDLVLGDLSGFLARNVAANRYDKVFDLGHLSFYRNSQAVNRLYEVPFRGCIYWPYIRDSKIVWVFDEAYDHGMGGINGRMLSSNFRLYNERLHFSDVHPGYLGFFDVNNEPSLNCFYTLKDRTLKRYSRCEDELYEREIIYAHFQKRNVQIIDAPDGGKMYVPSYWSGIRSFMDAVDALSHYKSHDVLVEPAYVDWKRKRKYKKVFNMTYDLLTVPGALRALRSML